LKKIISVVGARPNFMKVAPLHRAFLDSGKIESVIVHTGQHYDAKMSDIFFNQLGLPEPHYFLGIGGGTHTHQTANIMLKFEEIIQQEKPDVVLVVGDVNSTLACSIVGVKMGIKTVHVEAGLRSGDRSMPEEINRIITDSICDKLFVTEQSGLDHLKREGISDDKIAFVGNVMIDSLVHFREKANGIRFEEILGSQAVHEKNYVLVTMHRPSNVDNLAGLESILRILRGITKEMPVVFPMHPRTRKNIERFGLTETFAALEQVHILEPQGYLQFLNLMDNAKLVITDSGGIQEETTFLQIPCITFRASTERPVTVELGTNILIENLDSKATLDVFSEIHKGKVKQGVIPPLWDGKSSERICKVLLEL